MSEWQKLKLSDFVGLGKDQFKPDQNADFNYIGLEHIEQESLRLNSIGHSSEIASNKFFFKTGDILFGKLRPYFRKVVKTKLDGVCSTDIWVVRAKKNFSQDFVFYFMANWEFIDTANAGEGGSRMPRADWNFLKETEWIVPSYEEQKAIASVLSSLDDKIDLLHRQNKTLEAMAEALFRQWFVEEAEGDWEEVTIGDFVELNRASIDKNYPYQAIEYLDTGSLTDGKIENFQSYALNDAPSRAKRLVQHNDVLISTVRPDQKHYGIIKNPIENLVVSTGFCVLTCSKIDPHFIYLLLTNNEMTDYLHTIAEGSTSTYPSLKPSDIGAIVFQLPPIDRLKEFSIIAQNLWEKIEKNHIQIRTLETLRDTLLPKLMSGEVRVTV